MKECRPGFLAYALSALLASSSYAAPVQKVEDLGYNLVDLFRYHLTYSAPRSHVEGSGVASLYSAFYTYDISSGQYSCISPYSSNFLIENSGPVINDASHHSASAFYYCYFMAGSSPYELYFNRESSEPVVYDRVTSQGSETALPSSLRGYSSQNEALQNIQQYGNLKINRKISLNGFYAVHAKSLEFSSGGGIDVTNGALLLIVDGAVTESMSSCNTERCKTHPVEYKQFKLTNAYILADSIVFNTPWVELPSNYSYTHEFGSIFHNVRLSARNIRITGSSLQGRYIDDPNMNTNPAYYLASNKIGFPASNIWRFEEYVTQEGFVVSTSGENALCEQGWVAVTSKNGLAESVSLAITSGNAVFSNGSSSITVEADGSRIPVVARSAGNVKVSVTSGQSSECETDCGITFSEAVLRILPEKNVSSSYDSSSNAFYAGAGISSYLAVVKTSDADPQLCEAGTLKDNSATLTLAYNTAVNAAAGGGRSFVRTDNGEAVASAAGRQLTLSADGSFYEIPAYRYLDAGSVTLRASGVIAASGSSSGSGEATQQSDDTGITLTGEATLRFAPYGIQISRSGDACAGESECEKLSLLGDEEKYLSGAAFDLRYTPRAWCAEAGSSRASADIAKCAALASYGYDDQYQAQINVRAENLFDESDEKGNYLNPADVTVNQRATADATGSRLSDGSTLRSSYITDAGSYRLYVSRYTDPLSGLVVEPAQYDLDGLVAPYYFELSQYATDAPFVPNSCLAAKDGQLSFTYFGQPVTPRFYVAAKSKDGSLNRFFAASSYSQIGRYQLAPELFSSYADTAEPVYSLIDGVRSRRIVSCGDRCGDSEVAASWNAGRMYLNATAGEMQAISGQTGEVSAALHFRILASGYNLLDHREGLERNGGYRDEAPTLKDGTTWSRFYVYPGVSVKETAGDVSVYRQVKASGTGGALHSYTDLEGRTAQSLLFETSPLEMRTGRLALANGRAAPTSDLYMPIRAEYYRRAERGGSEIASGWVVNSDDSCTVLNKDLFFIEPFSGASADTVYLKNSASVNYGNGMKSEAFGLVSLRDGSQEPADSVMLKGGLAYLYLKKPESANAAGSAMFLLRDISAGLYTDIAAVGSSLLRDIPSPDGDPAHAGPYWLGTTLEGVDQAMGAFRAWPGNDRVLYRLDAK
ncbi:MAG: hypothetical protein IJ523_04690 [Succinivibrionaceae bacterium]|nr:hypothetical protein [Succinivibrionaceae bacterium]